MPAFEVDGSVSRSYTGAPADRHGVFDALLPGWSSPATVAAVLLAWALVDAVLVAVVARVGDRRALVAGLLLAGLSVGGALVVVRTHDGRVLGNAALLARGVLVVLAGVTARSGGRRRLLVVAVALLATLVLFLPVVVLFGEATVAP